MPRYNVEHKGMWACFSSITDSFITPFMEKDLYGQWRLNQYGKADYHLAEYCNKMPMSEVFFAVSLNRSYEETMEHMLETGLTMGEAIRLLYDNIMYKQLEPKKVNINEICFGVAAGMASGKALSSVSEQSKTQHFPCKIADEMQAHIIPDTEIQIRRHKRKRINKKWAKRYGFRNCGNPIPENVFVVQSGKNLPEGTIKNGDNVKILSNSQTVKNFIEKGFSLRQVLNLMNSIAEEYKSVSQKSKPPAPETKGAAGGKTNKTYLK